MFLLLEESKDLFEVQVIKRIKDDYDRFHNHDLLEFEKLYPTDQIMCPICKSKFVISHGKDKNGTKRYKCKNCSKTFNKITDSIFFSSKINIQSWFAFIECILSGSSTSVACITAKISAVTGTEWMHKIFEILKNYQNNIVLNGTIYIDETYVHEDTSKIFLYDEIGQTKKVRKQPRGISRNKICILAATNNQKSFMEIVGHGRPARLKNYEICKRHIEEKSYLIGDEDTSLTYASRELNLKRKMIKSYTQEAFDVLEPIDQLCNRFKFFINKHRGFKKEYLADYINLFIFMENERVIEKDLYKITLKLLKMMFAYKRVRK